MEKSQFKLCMKVLQTLQGAGVLEHIVLAGSWSVYFYKYYFSSEKYISTIRTRDIDFVVPIPFRLKKKIDVVSLLKAINFDVQFEGRQGYIKLQNPELTVEFLVVEKGKGRDKPYPLPALGINALALRYMSMLTDDTVKVKAEGIILTLPHPAAYALHKFIIFRRRKNADKISRDVETAKRVYMQLLESREKHSIGKIYKGLHAKWRKTIIDNLKFIKENEIVQELEAYK